MTSMIETWLAYNPETGEITWKRSPNRRVRVGSIAGSPSKGYVKVKVEGKLYFAHHVAWKLMTGDWPEQVDHENGCRNDNRWSNLRQATAAQNRQNVFVAQSNNSSGFRGVFHGKRKWQAAITVAGKTKHLGVFDTPEEAHEAYKAAKRVHHPFAREK